MSSPSDAPTRSKSKPVLISGRRPALAADSATALPKTTRRKAGPAAAARTSRSSSTVARHRRKSTSTTDTSKRRLGVTSSLLGKDGGGYEECSPINFNPRTYLDLNTRYPRRVGHEESGSYNDASLSYAALSTRDPAVATLSRTQMPPSQQPIPANPSFQVATATLGNLQRGPRGSTSNLDMEGWSPDPASASAKHHKQSTPMRLHSQRMDRPMECEHGMPCWNLLERREQEWDQQQQQQPEDLMAGSGRALPASATAVAGLTGLGNASNATSGGCHHHRRLATLPDQSDPYFYPETEAMNMEWETKPMAQTSSFTGFPRNYTSLQVPGQRTYHTPVSPQAQEPYGGNSLNSSPSRNGFQCSQQPSPFPSYACAAPAATCCNQGSPMTPTNGGPSAPAPNIAPHHSQNYGHSHYGGCGCGNMHQSRSPDHFHQFVPVPVSVPVPLPTGPISASGSNTSANLNVQMQNSQALRRAVRPPRTMLLNAAAAGAHITNSRGRMAARQNVHGRRPFRSDQSMSCTRMHHCRRVPHGAADCPHRNACRLQLHACSHNHPPRPSNCQ